METEFKVVCSIPPHTALERLEKLLRYEGVRIKTEGIRITSISTPFYWFLWGQHAGTRANCVGINPFCFVTAVDASIEGSNTFTTVTLRINRSRAVGWAAYYACLACLVGAVIPAQPAGMLFALFVSLAGWLLFVEFVGKRLMQTEIKAELRT